MPDHTEDQLTEPIATERPPGMVSSACGYTDHNGQRFIQIRGVNCYVYDLDDRTTASMIWITIYRAGHASLVEIAEYAGLPLRSLQRWNAIVKKEGLPGLAPKPKPGRPRTILTVDRELAVMLIDCGKSPGQVATQLGISYSSLRSIIAEHRENPSQQWLDFGDDETSLEIPGPTVPTETGPDRTWEETGQSQRFPADPPVIDYRGPRDDPSDRSYDRSLAKMGLLEDAVPVFASGQKVEGAGFLIFVALLGQTRVLDIFDSLYQKSLGPAFYGLRTTVMTILMMLSLRIKRPENLRQNNPAQLGRALGLDRVMEAKTLRKKLGLLADRNQGVKLMELLGEDRIKRLPGPTDGQLNAIYVDGHVKCYYGGFKTGQTWSATKNRVVKGKTNTWLNLPCQTPLIYLESSFNEGLASMLEENKERIEEIYGGKPVLVFDREGWDVDFLHELDKAGWRFVTYRKGEYEYLPAEIFEEVETKVGKRTYAHAPHDIEEQPYNHYQAIDNDGTQTRKKVGQVTFREIRVLSDDKSHQTAIVTNIDKPAATAIVISATLFERWGNQENVFKYMIAEYGLDDLWEYNRSDERPDDTRKPEEEIPGHIDHPNPAYTKLTNQIAAKTGRRTKLLARYGLALEQRTGDNAKDISAEELVEFVKKINSGKDAAKLKELNQEVIDLRAERSKTPKRESVSPAGYKQLRRGVSQIVDSLKMAVYDIETQLFEMLGAHYPNQAKDGRKLIVAALSAAGTLKITEDKIVVHLVEQATPKRTEAIDAVCRELNALQTVYPGTNLRIEFDTHRG